MLTMGDIVDLVEKYDAGGGQRPAAFVVHPDSKSMLIDALEGYAHLQGVIDVTNINGLPVISRADSPLNRISIMPLSEMEGEG